MQLRDLQAKLSYLNRAEPSSRNVQLPPLIIRKTFLVHDTALCPFLAKSRPEAINLPTEVRYSSKISLRTLHLSKQDVLYDSRINKLCAKIHLRPSSFPALCNNPLSKRGRSKTRGDIELFVPHRASHVHMSPLNTVIDELQASA